MLVSNVPSANSVPTKVLLVDDDENILELLKLYFTKEGYEIETAKNGREALEKARSLARDPSTRTSLIILDVMLPDLDGWNVCRRLREEGPTIPIIMLTAKGEDYDKILGLELGADDYVTKPFNPVELLARAKAVLRRAGQSQAKDPQDSQTVEYPHLAINLRNYEARVDGELVPLTRKETELLWLLAANPGKVFTREQLIELVWKYEYYGDVRTVDVHIKRIREKLRQAFTQMAQRAQQAPKVRETPNGTLVENLPPPEAPWNIKTVWGVGYKFEVLS